MDSQGKSMTIFYPDAPPETQGGKESLGDEVLPELEITVEQVFTQAGLL